MKIQKLLGRSLFALSGGEKQKIACASVSAMEPEIFVLDEPSSNLDIAAIGELKKILKQWKAQGKTTFANVLCGLVKKANGHLWMNGKEYKAKQRLKLCYMVMQDVNHQLFTESVLDEILLSLNEKDEEKALQQAQKIMDGLSISEYKDSHPMALSGGQKQRVAIASAIASDKELIVFDEPTSGLDYRHMKEVAENIRMLSQLGKTIFIVTHDPELIQECCNYFVFMEKGQVKWSDGWNEGSCDISGYKRGSTRQGF